MIWFDIKQLEQNLKDDKVSEKETFIYLLVLLLISTIAPYLGDQETNTKIITWTKLILEVTLTFLTLKVTYDNNARGDNRDYVKRFMSLSLVLTVRLIVFAIPVVFVGLTVIQILESMKLITLSSLDDLFNFGMILGLGVAYYLMLTQSFKRINSAV